MHKAMLTHTVSGMLLFLVQLVLTALFFVQVITLNILPVQYLVMMVVLLFLLLVVLYMTQYFLKFIRTGKIISIVSSVLLSLCCVYLVKIQTMFTAIASVNTHMSDLAVVVMKDDQAQVLADAKDYTFGIQDILDRSNTTYAIRKLNEDLNKEVASVPYHDLPSQVEALYRGDVQAIILNEAYRDIIKETLFTFDERTKVLYTIQIRNEVIKEDKEKDVTNDPFMVYVSGIDAYGSIAKTSRSDVNIIATVHPQAKQILLTNTPRDYFIPLSISGGQMDKLTHAGLYGVDVSVQSLEALYDIPIDYYVRVNFNSLIQLVDVLGGITVYSEYVFYSNGHYFNKGKNFLNGKEALTFSRERKAFEEGDVQRGNNQMAVMVGLIDALTSPAVLRNAGTIMQNLGQAFETNMSVEAMTSLVKMQLSDMARWHISVNGVTGTPSSEVTYTYKTTKKYVTIPDQSSVDAAKLKMKYVIGDSTIIDQ